jgi:RNA polymerase sigma-70 factor (sigma-E family)
MNAVGEVIGGRAIGIFQPSEERLSQLGVWFAAEYPALLRFAYFVSGDAALAEDLVQDAFVRIYRAGARVEEPTFKAYARTAIVNLSRTSFRRRARERTAVEVPGSVAPHDPGERDEMWRALQQLSPRQRACVALRFYEDMKEREIAAALGMSVGSVKKHTDRAMARLRELLGRQS